jgi:hypothetical protein
MTAHWGVADPAEATGAAAEIALAFKNTYRMLNQRIGVFVALPISSLDQSGRDLRSAERQAFLGRPTWGNFCGLLAFRLQQPVGRRVVRGQNMVIHRLMVLSAAAVAVLTSNSFAGPCSLEIDRLQTRIQAMLGAEAAVGPSERESTSALLHRQPTPGSIAAAEERLREASATRAKAFSEALARARAADRAGEKKTCEQALADGLRTIAPLPPGRANE